MNPFILKYILDFKFINNVPKGYLIDKIEIKSDDIGTNYKIYTRRKLWKV